MGILKKARHSKIDVFVKFESAINLEISSQKSGFLLFGSQGPLCMHFHQNLGRSRFGHWGI